MTARKTQPTASIIRTTRLPSSAAVSATSDAIGGNLPQAPGVRADRTLDGVVARRRTCGCVERRGVAAQPQRGARVVELRPAAEERRGRRPERRIAVGLLGAQLA